MINIGVDYGSLALDVVILAIFFHSQLKPRPVRFKVLIPALLALVGIGELSAGISGINQHYYSSVEISIAGSIALAALTAAIRAPAVHLWPDGDRIWRKGTKLTIFLWIASLTAHLFYESMIMQGSAYTDLGESTLLLYFAVSLFVQRILVKIRAGRLRKVASIQSLLPKRILDD